MGASAGYSPDLGGLLTGTSISGSIGNRTLNYNFGTNGSSLGVGFGTPRVGVTYGFGPYRFGSGAISADVNRPASFDDRFGSSVQTAASVPLLQALERYRAEAMRSAKQEPTPSVFERGATAVPFFSVDHTIRAGGLLGKLAGVLSEYEPSELDRAGAARASEEGRDRSVRFLGRR